MYNWILTQSGVTMSLSKKVMSWMYNQGGNHCDNMSKQLGNLVTWLDLMGLC